MYLTGGVKSGITESDTIKGVHTPLTFTNSGFDMVIISIIIIIEYPNCREFPFSYSQGTKPGPETGLDFRHLLPVY